MSLNCINFLRAARGAGPGGRAHSRRNAAAGAYARLAKFGFSIASFRADSLRRGRLDGRRRLFIGRPRRAVASVKAN